MNSELEQRRKDIDKKIAMVALADMPGSILVGLGLYAKFAANGNAFHPLLNNESTVDSMLALGGAIMLWGAYQVIKLARKKANLKSQTSA